MPPTPRTRILGANLRNARVEAKFGLRELARRIGVSPAMLSSWEQARRSPSVADVASILGAIGTTGETKHHILRLASGTAEESWIVHGAPLSTSRATALLTHKHAAQSVVTWDPLSIPELLQVADRHPGQRSTLIEAFISDRALRAEHIHPGVLRRQLLSLAQLTKTSRLFLLRTVPADVAWSYGLATAFDRYCMTDGETVVYSSQRNLGIFITERSNDASPPRADAELLRQIADEPEHSFVQTMERVAALTSVRASR